jgi:rhodanese-related sulfurtransferase
VPATLETRRNGVTKKILAVLLLILLPISIALATGYRNISAAEAKKMLATNKNVFLLDVRTPEEYRQARLKGSVLIPINEIERRLAEIPRNRPILVYCAVGSRSVPVAGFLGQKGWGEIYNMSDGIVGWYRNGYPIER